MSPSPASPPSTPLFPWGDIWKKDTKALDPFFPTRKTEDFFYFPLPSMPQYPLPQAKTSASSITEEILSLLSLDGDANVMILENGELSHEKLPHFSSILEKTISYDYTPLQKTLLEKTPTDYFKGLSLAKRSFVLNLTFTNNPQEDEPFHLIFVHTKEESLSCPQVFINLKPHVKSQIIVHHIIQTQNPPSSDKFPLTFFPYLFVKLENYAKLELSFLCKGEPSSFLFSYTDLHQGAFSESHIHLVSVEGDFVRQALSVRLSEKNAKSTIDGLAIVSQKNQSEFFTRVFHEKPQTFSDQFFKAIARSGGKFSFNGDVVVLPHAKGVKAYQLSKNLLLDKDSSIFARPQLHVEHNDLACSHGATIGRFSEEEEFYLKSRGISESVVGSLLLSSFTREIFEKFPLVLRESPFLKNIVVEE